MRLSENREKRKERKIGENKMVNKLIFPLDYSDVSEARTMALKLKAAVGMFKVGLELFTLGGPSIIETIKKETGKSIMLDLKYFDIPTTVIRALKAAQALPVRFITFRLMSDLVRILRPIEFVSNLIGVRRLTSDTGLSDDIYRTIDLYDRCESCSGLVCDHTKLKSLRGNVVTGEAILITPGIRPKWYKHPDDQWNTTTPKEAIKNGADYIIVGRPIRNAVDPVKAANKIVEEMMEVEGDNFDSHHPAHH